MSIVLFGLADKGEINMEQLAFRKARPEDLAQVFALFTDAIHTMDKDGIPQWDEVYPDERTLKEDIEHGQMYLAELEERPAAVFVLNLEYDPQYANGVWAEPDSFLRKPKGAKSRSGQADRSGGRGARRCVGRKSAAIGCV